MQNVRPLDGLNQRLPIPDSLIDEDVIIDALGAMISAVIDIYISQLDISLLGSIDRESNHMSLVEPLKEYILDKLIPDPLRTHAIMSMLDWQVSDGIISEIITSILTKGNLNKF